MAIKTVLVVGSDGEYEQLQPGDTINAYSSTIDVYSFTNGEATAITKGMVVYIDAANSVKKARANAGATSHAYGLVIDASVAAGGSAFIATDGVITGLSGGTAGATAWLDAATAGAITTTPPTSGYQVKVGTWLSATELELGFGHYTRL
jgi:hypothetical protein